MRDANGDAQHAQRERGANVVIGLVLLFAMVIAGSTLVFLVGSPMFDALQSQADREKVSMCMDESDHRLSTVVKTGQEQSMAFDDPDCQAEVVEGGTITIAKYDNSSEDPPWDDETRTASAELDAYELELDDWTVAHQGGGIWELSDGSASVDKAPEIGFENNSPRLSLMQLERTVDDGSISRARNDPDAAAETTERFAEVAANSTYDDFAIRIESEYADGWEQHFEREADGVSGWDVSVERPEDNVVILKAELSNTEEPENDVQIEADHGLVADRPVDEVENNLVAHGSWFLTNATITNNGDVDDEITVTISILDDSGVVDERTIKAKNGAESMMTSDPEYWDGKNDLIFKPESIGLIPGEYEYDIEIEGGDSLDQRGSFYYLHDDANYAVTDTWTNSSEGAITVSADVQNLGSKDGLQDVTLEISPEDGDSVTTSTKSDIDLGSGQSGTVSWTINESDWPNGGYAYDIEVGDDADGDVDSDAANGTFEVTEGGAFRISEDLGVPIEEQADGTDGQVISEENDVTISANITNTYLREQTQNVTLHVLDEEGTAVRRTETTLTVDGGETTQANLTVDPLEAGEIYEYNISTEDDDLDTRGSFLVVEEPSEFAIDDVEVVDDPVKPHESVTVSVDVENEGDSDTQYVWLEGFDGSIVAIDELELESGEEQTVTLEWSSVGIPESSDETAITVGTGTDSATAAVEIDPLLEVNDLTVVEKEVTDEQTVSSEGRWNRNEDVIGKTLELTVEAEVQSVAGDAEQTVVLEGFDGDPVTTDVTVPTRTTETVTFEYETPDNSVTDRITLRTEDDEMDEVVVIERDGPACGTVRYEGRGTSADPYQVSTVDQLQCIEEHDLDADYELVEDIDAQGTEYWNDGAGFRPIGEQTRGGNEFTGDFDGNGHAIGGLHIDRPNEDFVGLFAVNSYFDDVNRDVGEGSKIHNLRLENVSVHGRQVTGGLIGAAGGVIENVRVSGTVEAEYQEVGGIAGVAHNGDLDNRLVSEATVRGGLPAAAVGAEHPWDANNLGIGGIIGSTGWNTEVSTAYSQADVEGPFGVGGIVGWTSDYASANEQMYWAEGEITITADQYERDPEHYLNRMGRGSHGTNTGGAIFGRGDDVNDEFADSVYYNEEHHDHPFGEHVIGDRIDVTERSTDEMRGLDVTEAGNLENLDYEGEGGPWVALPDDYPRFAWELAAEGRFDVEIDSVENVTAGEAAEVDVTVTSRYEDSDESDVTQTISLTDPEGRTVDTRSVTLPSTLGTDERKTITLVWQTGGDDSGTGNVSVRSADMTASAPITVAAAEYGPGSSDGPAMNLTPDSDVTESESDYGPGESDSSGDDLSDVDSEIAIDVDVVTVS